MQFLVPLYFLGALAIGLPILFHLIRRHPQGKQFFSSLMFLSPSPPRLTKRSRLNNILLLLLRALAIVLLAFAFARPYLNNLLASDKTPSSGRKIALLVDISASMRRADLWDQAQKKADAFLKTITPADQVALFLFDDQVHPAFGFDQWNKAEPGDRVKLLEFQLASAKPTFAGTKLGDALANVADQLTQVDQTRTASGDTHASDTMPRLIELISDMQNGAGAQALQGHQWPPNVVLNADPVALADKPNLKTNASLQWVAQLAPGDDDKSAGDQDKLRVWVNNEAGGTKDQFALAWADKDGVIPGIDPLKIYVPAGHKQIVRIPWSEPVTVSAPATLPATQPVTRPVATTATAPAATRTAGAPASAPAIAQAPPARVRTADRLVLSGDDFDFDNTLYVVPPRTDRFNILYLGEDGEDQVDSLHYLQSALDDPHWLVSTIARTRAHPPTAADFAAARLVVLTEEPRDDTQALLRKYLESGGNALWVLDNANEAPALGKLLGIDGIQMHEADGPFALIADVDTTNPLLAPFAEAQYGDFTKIHFWHHRVVELPADATSAGKVHIVARFDDQSPFLMEAGIGRGLLRIFTSGWSTSESQLQVAGEKFVPMIQRSLKRRDEVATGSQFVVHETIALPSAGSAPDPAAPRSITTPEGKTIDLPAAAANFDGTDTPGIYMLKVGKQDSPLAVNIPPEESDTQPRSPEELSQWGAILGSAPKTAGQVMVERRRQAEDLENQQKIWRWIILCVLGLLGVETLLAGSIAHRARDIGVKPGA